MEQLGRTDLLAEGHQLNKAELLFEKIEDETIQAQVDKLLATKKENEAASYKANPIKPTISFEEFEKLDIRVGTVLECETVPKMKKLLKFKIADGLENRTIVSGIAQHYAPEELVRKTSVVHCKPGSPPIQKRLGKRRHDSKRREL